MSDSLDKDLDWELAFVEELKTCSVGTRDDFHFGRFLMRASVKKHHDALIDAWKYRIPFTPYPELAPRVLDSLERKKNESTAGTRTKSS